MLVSMIVSVNRGMSACDDLFVKRKAMMPMRSVRSPCPGDRVGGCRIRMSHATMCLRMNLSLVEQRRRGLLGRNEALHPNVVVRAPCHEAHLTLCDVGLPATRHLCEPVHAPPPGSCAGRRGDVRDAGSLVVDCGRLRPVRHDHPRLRRWGTGPDTGYGLARGYLVLRRLLPGMRGCDTCGNDARLVPRNRWAACDGYRTCCDYRHGADDRAPAAGAGGSARVGPQVRRGQPESGNVPGFVWAGRRVACLLLVVPGVQYLPHVLVASTLDAFIAPFTLLGVPFNVRLLWMTALALGTLAAAVVRFSEAT